MADRLSYNPSRAANLGGAPVPFARAHFYDAGTTDRRQTYADSDLSAVNPWPLVADSSGVFPPAFVDGGGAVAVDVKDPNGASLPGYPIDPVERASDGSTGAARIAFTPTGNITATDVQTAIEQVADLAAAGYQEFGLGVSSAPTILANIDIVSIASGFYAFDGTTEGTFPAGVTKANGGTVEVLRLSSSAALMRLNTVAGITYSRILAGSVWGAWLNGYLVGDGTAAAPAWSWVSDPNTGVYRPAADQWAVSTGGAQRLLVTTTALTTTVPVRGTAGAAGSPSFSTTGDTDTGMYFPSANELAFATGGTERLRINGAGLFTSPTGIVTSPTDATPGRLLTQGYMGLGGSGAEVPGGDCNNATQNGTYRVSGAVLNTPYGSGPTGSSLSYSGFSATFGTQTFMRSHPTLGAVWVRDINNGVWTAWRRILTNSEIVGAVSQSGGSPTGAIVERGSNGDGEYVRYADGTQICWKVQSINMLEVTTAIGSVFRGQAGNHPFPAAFSSVQHVNASVLGSGNAILRSNLIGARTRVLSANMALTWDGAYVYSAASATAADGELTAVSLFAIGRWF